MSHCYKSWAQAALESFCNSRAHQGGFLFSASLWSIHRCTNFVPSSSESGAFQFSLSALRLAEVQYLPNRVATNIKQTLRNQKVFLKWIIQ